MTIKHDLSAIITDGMCVTGQPAASDRPIIFSSFIRVASHHRVCVSTFRLRFIINFIAMFNSKKQKVNAGEVYKPPDLDDDNFNIGKSA